MGSQEISPKGFFTVLNLNANQGWGQLVEMCGRFD